MSHLPILIGSSSLIDSRFSKFHGKRTGTPGPEPPECADRGPSSQVSESLPRRRRAVCRRIMMYHVRAAAVRRNRLYVTDEVSREVEVGPS